MEMSHGLHVQQIAPQLGGHGPAAVAESSQGLIPGRVQVGQGQVQLPKQQIEARHGRGQGDGRGLGPAGSQIQVVLSAGPFVGHAGRAAIPARLTAT